MADSSSEELIAQILMLKQSLVDKDEEIQTNNDQLVMAGKFGQELMETNTALHKQIDDMSQEFNDKTQKSEQEIYTLKLKLETKAQMETNLAEEVEHVRNSLRREREKYDNFINIEHQAALSDLRKKLRNAQADTEKAQLLEKQSNEKIAEMEDLLRDAHDSLEQYKSKMNETCSDEIAQLHEDLNALQNEKMKLSGELSERNQYVERLEHDLKSTHTKLQSKDAEIEEKQCLATSYYNALEKSREEVQELRVELDIIKMEAQDKKAKGNSLFSEVEDRRIEAEKMLINMRVQNETLTKQLKFAKDNHHKLKMQMAGFLQMAGGRANSEAVNKLQSQLAQARDEITSLNARISLQETQLKKKNSEMTEMMSQMSSGSDQQFSDYLKALIAIKEHEVEKLTDEIKNERFLKLATQDQLIRSEQKVYNLELQASKLKGQVMKVNVRLEELQMKYEPEKCKQAKERVVFVEKLPGFENKDEQTKSDVSAENKENAPEKKPSTVPEGFKSKLRYVSKKKRDANKEFSPNQRSYSESALTNQGRDNKDGDLGTGADDKKSIDGAKINDRSIDGAKNNEKSVDGAKNDDRSIDGAISSVDETNDHVDASDMTTEKASFLSKALRKDVDWGAGRQRPASESRVKFSTEVDVRDISANTSANTSELSESKTEHGMEGGVKTDGGRVRGRQTFNRVVKIPKAKPAEEDAQCQQQ